MTPPVKRFSEGLPLGERCYPPTFDPVVERRAVRIIDHLAHVGAHFPEATATLSADGELLAIIYGEAAERNARGVGPALAAADIAQSLDRLADCCAELVNSFQEVPMAALNQWVAAAVENTPLAEALTFATAAEFVEKLDLMARGARCEAAALRSRRPARAADHLR